MPAYARYRLDAFTVADPDAVLGRLQRRYAGDGFGAEHAAATLAWREQIRHLQQTARELLKALPAAKRWHVLLEYPLARRGKRIDAVLLAADVVFVLEYKTGGSPLAAADRWQVEEYALDLRDFHAASRGRTIVPVLVTPNRHVATEVPPPRPEAVQAVHVTGDGGTDEFLAAVFTGYHKPNEKSIGAEAWDDSPYRPVPTIVEAARALYADHSVRDITRSEAGAENLSRTSRAVLDVIREAERDGRKAICFVTGVPGAGKTLAGLNVVHGRELHPDRDVLGVYLSGNGPLVRVLVEALAADRAGRPGVTRADARRAVSAFVQNVHGFLDEHAGRADPPPDRVAVFDEAQRAWDAEQSERSRFRREGSEPAQMLRVMDRHPGWAVVVALVGNGQEINRGEAGLPEWGRALSAGFGHWHVHVSPALAFGRPAGGHEPLFAAEPTGVAVRTHPSLHLSVSRRSFRAESLSAWVDAVLAGDANAARAERARVPEYPLALTRDLDAARDWLRARARGTRRAGLVASSGARRLRPYGIDVAAELDEPAWFLNPPDDVRASPFLELAATEFAVQGLELDWAGVCWDADVRRAGGAWAFHEFRGTRWQKVNDAARQRYARNKYRVLLTRAREGMVFWVPPGSARDPSRAPAGYDETADYLRACGADPLRP